MFVAAVIAITSAIELDGLRAADRNAVLTALEERSLMGMPRHVDHDEGEELQQAITAALAANPTDFDMAWAAVRASFAILPNASRVIGDSLPSVGVKMVPPFTLPWKITADVALDASVDGADWQHAGDIPRGAKEAVLPIEKLFPDAGRPGFHAVRLRAKLTFTGAPEWLPATVSHDLPSFTYGITGASADGQRIQALENSAALASAFDLDRTLPQMPLGVWLQTVARPPDSDSPPVYWVTQWCETRTGLDDEPLTSICAHAVVGSMFRGAHADVWIKVATVDGSSTKPSWTLVSPSVEAIDLIDSAGRASGDLATLPSALRSSAAEWPHAAFVLDDSSITVSPASPAPREPVTIAIEMKNPGATELIGALVDLTVGDATIGPALVHRQFVRSIPAGESVTVKTDAQFPHGYGVVSVLAIASSHGTFPNLLIDESNSGRVAARFVRPELAPPGFVKRMTSAIGTR